MTETELKRLRAQRGLCKSTITRIENFINDPINVASSTIDTLEARKEKLISTLKNYESVHLDILNLDGKDTECVGEIEDKYFAVLGKINVALRQLKTRVDSERHSISTCKLPNIEISTFDGKDFAQFKPFMDLFNAVIDRNNSLSNVQKLFYLRKYLTADALAVIINLPLVNESYPEAIKLLKKRFDNETRIISNHIGLLLDIPQMQKGTATSIRSFISEVRQQLYALINLKQPVESWDMLLISILSRKLDSYTNRAYHLDRLSPDNLPTMEEFMSFLEKRAIALEDSSPQKSTCYEGKSKSNNNNNKVSNIATKTNSKRSCTFCNNDHPIYTCPKFKLAPASQRIKFATDNKLCTTCLRNHPDKCKYSFKCQVCKDSHNTLLHEDKSKEDEVISLHSNLSTIETNILLPTMKVKLIDKAGQEIEVKALLDCGSQVCIIKRTLVNQLGLTPMAQDSNIIGLGNTPNKVNECANILLQSTLYNVKCSIKCHIVDTITTNLPQNYFDFKKCNIPANVQLADNDFNKPSEIALLLGVDFYSKVIIDGVIKLDNGLVLQNTLFGHVVTGTIKSECKINLSSVNLVSNFVMQEKTDESLENIMKNFWLSEKITEEVVDQNIEFEKAEKIFQNSVKLENNQFSVDIPLQCPLEELNIGDSFSCALQRFHTLEKKFETNPDYFKTYKKFIDEYVELGHAREVDISQYDVLNDPVYFLAHHAVQNEGSKTTKLRVVFEGNLKSKNGLSANDVMLNGPIVQNELFNILILFRSYRYTIMCDVEKMFRMIFINEKFRPLQNILWRDHPSKPITCLQLQTITYGLKASTFLSTRCLMELTHLYHDRYPRAVEALRLSTYIDDVITGADNLEQLLELKTQLIELMKLGNFKLHKWCSNSQESIKDLPDNVKYFEQIDLNKDNIMKTLGLKYNTNTDTLMFSCPMADDYNLLKTKRKILSFIGKIFDPIGLIGPIVVQAKLLMQEIWKSKVDWDSTLPGNILKSWKEFLMNLNDMGIIQIPRAINNIGVENIESVELVGYSDASLNSTGCCLYLRVLSNDGQVNVSLLCSKSRVAPLNRKLTIPNLELNGALLLAELASRVNKTLQIRYPNLKVYLHTDSQVVLAWINSHSSKGVYVTNRVNKIRMLTKDFMWSHIKGVNNPADVLSRGTAPHKLQDNQLWWFGPSSLLDKNFQHNTSNLQNNEQHVAVSISEIQESTTLNNINVCNLQQKTAQVSDNIFDKYSDFNKLQRVIALLLRFKHNSLNPNDKLVGSIMPKELQSSNSVIIRHVQHKAFSNEIQLLEKGSQIKNHMASLHPFLDCNTILRVGGRLQNATNLSYDKKHPIILPKSNHITNLIIIKEHLRLLHAGAKLVLSSLSQRFWLLNGIREVKKVVHKCVKCFRLKATAAKQLMGSLPSHRISTGRVFEITGVDFCGPFDIKVARIRKAITKKSYVALFVCFATKAIHIELVSDMTTEAFLACLQRFVARRGLPSLIYCDNAKTFKGAENKLKELYDLHSSKCHVENVENFCSTKLIRFKYIPSYSPEFGGLWEAGVKSAKHHIRRVIGNVSLTFEEFNTVLTQIESILNSRPLLPLSSDVSDLNYLTPGHFLVGTALTSYPELDVTYKNINRMKFWQLCTKLKQDFWKLWSRDYLTSLQNRPKWKYCSDNLKEGDLVIVKQKDISPLNWPMGRIVKTIPGPDGRVRVAEVRMGPKNNVYLRSYTKLCPVPMKDNLD